MRSFRALFALLALSSAASCNGKREPPDLTDSGNLSVGNGNGNGNGNGTGNNGGAGQGGQAGGFGGIGGTNFGGSGPVNLESCGCALETLDNNNANCQDCVQLATDRSADACFQRFDDCLANQECLAANQRLATCSSTPTTDCATTALEGTPHDSAVILAEFYDCLCAVCSNVCQPGDGQGGAGGGVGGAGGAGGSGQDGPCTINP